MERMETHVIRTAITQSITAVFFTIVTAVFSISSTHADSTKITYVYPDQIILISELNDEGEFNNPLNFVLEEMFKRAKLEWQKEVYPPKRMFQKLVEGHGNFSVLVNSPLLDECCLVGTLPVTKTELRVYHRDNVAAIADIRDLAGKKVITMRGYSYGPFKSFIADPSNNVHIIPTGTHASAFAMLKKGRADYLLDYKHPAIEVLKRQPIENLQFEKLKEINLYLILHRSYPNAEQVLAKLENIIENLGVEEILALPNDPPSSTEPRLRPKDELLVNSR